MEPEEEVKEDLDHEEIIFDCTLAQNGQVTIKKSIRDRLNLEPGDIVFLKIVKVITPKGETTYDVTTTPKLQDEE